MRRLLIGLAVLAAPSSAQTGSPAGQEADAPGTVVVTGDRQTREETRREAFEFVRRMGVANGERPAARWKDGVCPRVLGIAPVHARVVETKLRSVAAEAGAPIAPTPCRTNIAVLFTSDGPNAMKTVAARSPRRLAEVPAASRAALLDGPAPVRWWYTTELRGRHGDRLIGAEPPFVTGQGSPGQVLPGNGDTSFLSQYGSSIVSTQVIRVLTSATVVVDANLATGKALDTVAAYAALVALAEIRPGGAPAGSILALFDGAEAGRELTERDRAFLRALYRLPLDRQARQHRGRLASEVAAVRMGR